MKAQQKILGNKKQIIVTDSELLSKGQTSYCGIGVIFFDTLLKIF